MERGGLVVEHHVVGAGHQVDVFALREPDQAPFEELEGVPGVPAKTARSIYAQLHKAGRG